MRNILIATTLTLAMISTGVSQQSLFRGSSSAGAPGYPILFNCDFFDPIGLPGVAVTLHYRVEQTDYFTDLLMFLMDEPPFYLTTYETSQIFTVDIGSLDYYFSASVDSFRLTQAPDNGADQFPPASYMYAPFSSDPEGDTAGGTVGAWLDLTGSGMTYSDLKIYAYLDNVSHTWPTNQQLDFFAYAIGFLPPGTFDSTLYALVYANIPFVLTPGLYKLNLADTSFVRLGNIQNTVSGGKLHMSAAFTEFENDPDWPGWPPPSGFLISSAVTLTVGLSGQSVNDFAYPTYFEPQTYYLDFGSNAPPVLTDPDFEIIPGVSVRPAIRYLDADNNLPVSRYIHFDGSMLTMGSFDHTYSDTALFECVFGWPGSGWHTYSFVFSDGVDDVVTPLDSIYLSLTGIADSEPLPDQLSLSQNYPNPFNSSTLISFVLQAPGHVVLSVYDILGRRVCDLVDSDLSQGEHRAIWNGRNNSGQDYPAGIYFYRLSAGEKSITQKMVYLK